MVTEHRVLDLDLDLDLDFDLDQSQGAETSVLWCTYVTKQF